MVVVQVSCCVIIKEVYLLTPLRHLFLQVPFCTYLATQLQICSTFNLFAVPLLFCAALHCSCGPRLLVFLCCANLGESTYTICVEFPPCPPVPLPFLRLLPIGSPFGKCIQQWLLHLRSLLHPKTNSKVLTAIARTIGPLVRGFPVLIQGSSCAPTKKRSAPVVIDLDNDDEHHEATEECMGLDLWMPFFDKLLFMEHEVSVDMPQSIPLFPFCTYLATQLHICSTFKFCAMPLLGG